MLFWIDGQSDCFKLATPTGNMYTFKSPGDNLHSLKIDPFNQLWCLGGRANYWSRLEGFSPETALRIHSLKHRFKEKPGGVFFHHDGVIVFPSKSAIGFFMPDGEDKDGEKKYRARSTPRMKEVSEFCVASTAQDKLVFMCYTDRDQVIVCDEVGTVLKVDHFPAGTRPQAPALGPGA